MLIVVLIITGTGFFFYHRYLAPDEWKPALKNKVSAAILKSSKGLYHIRYSNVDVNVVAGNVTLSDFELFPDTVVYKNLVAEKRAPDDLFIINVKRFSVKDAGAGKAYLNKKLDIADIIINQPKVTIINKQYAYNDTAKTGSSKNIYNLIKNIFKEVKIGSVTLNDASVDYINNNQRIAQRTVFNHVAVNISNILIDSLSGSDTSRFYYTKGVEITLKGYGFKTPGGMYQASMDKLIFSTQKKQVLIYKAAFVPRFNHYEFYQKTKSTEDIYTLRFNKIAVNNINLQSLIRNHELSAAAMDISDSYIGIYSNDFVESKATSQIEKDPQQLLQKLSFPIRLKRINVKNANVVYSETDKESGFTGQVLFTHTNGYFLNVTNNAAAKAVNPDLKAHLNTRFMNEAVLDVDFKFNLNSKSGAFNYFGKLGKYDGRKLDKLVKPLALVHVVSADIDKLKFNIDANNFGSKGAVDFYYRDLKIQLLKKVKGKAALQKKGLITLLANDLILKDNNPTDKGVFRPGAFTLKRADTVSFFTFLYQGILEGLKPAVGLSLKNRGVVMKTLAKITGLAGKTLKRNNGTATGHKSGIKKDAVKPNKL